MCVKVGIRLSYFLCGYAWHSPEVLASNNFVTRHCLIKFQIIWVLKLNCNKIKSDKHCASLVYDKMAGRTLNSNRRMSSDFP